MSWVTNNEWLKADADHAIRWRPLRRFAENLRPFRGKVVVAALLALAGSGTVWLIPLLFWKIQAALLGRNVLMVALGLVGFLAISLAEAVTAHAIRVIRARISTRLNRELVTQYYRKILNLGVEDFIDFRRRTNLFQRVIDAMSITPQFTDVLLRGGHSLISLVVVGAAVAWVAWQVLAVAVVGAVLIFALVVLQSRELRLLRQRSLSLNYPLVGKMTEIIGGLFTIKTLAASVRVTSDVGALVEGKTEAEYDELKAESRASQAAAALRGVTLAFAMAQAAVMLMNGQVTVADLFALFILANLFLQPVAELGALYQSLSRLSVNVESFYEVLDLPDEAPAAPALPPFRPAEAPARAAERPKLVLTGAAVGANGTNPSPSPARILFPAGGSGVVERGHVVFRDVEFGYRSGPAVLSGVSLEIFPGEKVALIGRSGAGKTTLTRLLLGFLHPRRGQIEVDGADVATLVDRNGHRRQFGVVSQQDVMFGVSLRENLSFGLEDTLISDERMEEALRMVGLWDEVERLPGGLEARYSEDLFSGGQRQRFFIARALLRSPSIVVLDEPTSALDFESERKVMEAVERLVGGKTTLTIAHRLSTVRSADRVVVLEHGTVRATGTHRELYDTDDYYRALCEYNSFML